MQTHSDAAKKRWQDPLIRSKATASLSAAATRSWQDPEKRAARITAMRRSLSNKVYTQEELERRSAGRKRMWSRPEYVNQIRDSRKQQWEIFRIKDESSIWYGSVTYPDGPQYCEKWNSDLRERVRAFFGYQCVECGSLQNGERLHVHHVWYNKKACCDNTPRSLVPLCASCHGKTMTNRDCWSNHFQQMIDAYYGGRCWLTKSEMKDFILSHRIIPSPREKANRTNLQSHIEVHYKGMVLEKFVSDLDAVIKDIPDAGKYTGDIMVRPMDLAESQAAKSEAFLNTPIAKMYSGLPVDEYLFKVESGGYAGGPGVKDAGYGLLIGASPVLGRGGNISGMGYPEDARYANLDRGYIDIAPGIYKESSQGVRDAYSGSSRYSEGPATTGSDY